MQGDLLSVVASPRDLCLVVIDGDRADAVLDGVVDEGVTEDSVRAVDQQHGQAVDGVFELGIGELDAGIDAAHAAQEHGGDLLAVEMPICTGNSSSCCAPTAASTAHFGDANAAHTPSLV